MNNKIGVAIVMGLLVNSMGAMDPSVLDQSNQIKLITNDKKEVTISADERHYFGTIQHLVEEWFPRNENGSINYAEQQEAIPLPNISYAVFDQFLKDIRGRKDLTEIVGLCKNERRRRAIRSASALEAPSYTPEALIATIARLQGADYLDCDELRQRYAKMTAAMLISGDSLKAWFDETHPLKGDTMIILNHLKDVIDMYIPRIWVERFSIKDRAYNTAFSPNNQMVAISSGTSYAKIAVFSVNTGKKLYKRSDEPGPKMLKYSPDNTKLAITDSVFGIVRVVDAKDGKELYILKHPTFIRHVLFSPDNTMIATVSHIPPHNFEISHQKLKIFDVKSGSFLNERSYEKNIQVMSFSSDSKTLNLIFYGGDKKKEDALLNQNNENHGEVRSDDRQMQGSSFLPMYIRMVSIQNDSKRVKIVNTHSGLIEAILPHDNHLVGNVKISANDKMITTIPNQKNTLISECITNTFDQALLVHLLRWHRDNDREIKISPWMERVLETYDDLFALKKTFPSIKLAESDNCMCTIA